MALNLKHFEVVVSFIEKVMHLDPLSVL
jgi:hypothetical protein